MTRVFSQQDDTIGLFFLFLFFFWSNSREKYVFHQLMELMDEAAAPSGCTAARLRADGRDKWQPAGRLSSPPPLHAELPHTSFISLIELMKL